MKPIPQFATVLALVFSLLAVTMANAAEPVSKSRLSGVAIDGHDTVAYHSLAEDAKAVSGDSAHVVTWKGAKWRFQSAEDAARFEADPEAFSPAYNGFCANALSLGEGLIKTDGNTWAIFGDQLYLFYAPRGRARWKGTSDVTSLIADADAAWAKLSR